MRVSPYSQYMNVSSHSGLFQEQAARSRRADGGAANAKAAVSAEESIWHQVGARYDVRDLTEEELADMARELWSGGAISYQDYAMLTPKASTDSDAGESGRRYLTEADERGARDWVNEYEKLSDYLLNKGEPPTAQLVQRVLAVLTQVSLARSGPLNIRV